MKTPIQIILFIALAVAVMYLMFRNDDEGWKQKAESYKTTSDSLRHIVESIHEKTIMRDSLLLIYMDALRKTQTELNKEIRKNKDTLKAYSKLQDDIIAEYCRYMEQELKQKPDICK